MQPKYGTNFQLTMVECFVLSTNAEVKASGGEALSTRVFLSELYKYEEGRVFRRPRSLGQTRLAGVTSGNANPDGRNRFVPWRIESSV